MEKIRRRFWNKVNVRNISECWKWLAGSRNGYGCFYLVDKMYKAHRISYMLTFGEFSTKDLILHKCNNRLCVNPFHLYVGNKGNNADDCMGTIGRHPRWYKGELWLIRKLSLRINQSVIGKVFKVNQSTISDILGNKRYPSKESIARNYESLKFKSEVTYQI